MAMNTDRDSIGSAIGRIPSGCSILTAARGDRATGVLCSWVQQAYFDPPAVSIALKRGRPVTEWLGNGEPFLLNIIGSDPTALFKHFGKGFALEEDAFAGLAFEPSPYGPQIVDSLGHLGCRVLSRLPVGDHDLYVGEVLAGVVNSADRPYVHLRKSGFSY